MAMKFLSIYKTVETNTPPSAEHVAKMGQLIEESMRNGTLLGTEGCLPSSLGARVRLSDGKITVTDGPFTETKEVIGGFAILNYPSHEQAIAGARRVLQIHAEHGVTELEIELRPMMDPADCGQMPQQASAA
jgi:hypothetical protein